MDKFQNNANDQIFCGDCKEIMRRLPNNSVDLVVTDPPYLVNYRSSDGRKIVNDDNSGWIMPAFSQIYRVLKMNRFCISFYGWNKAERFLWTWWIIRCNWTANPIFIGYINQLNPTSHFTL